MADIIGDRVFDEGLDILTTDVERIVVLSAQATVYGDVATYLLGHKDTPTVTGPSDGASGRQVSVSTFTDGVVDGAGDVAAVALVNDTNSELLVSHLYGATYGVATGSPWSLTSALIVNLPDPT